MSTTSFPVPIGVTASFTPLAANTNSTQFYLPPGIAVVTFNPDDTNNPGTLTLYDQNANVILTMTSAGYMSFIVPGEDGNQQAGENFYFSCTNKCRGVAATVPTIWR